jgi:hypothetical protein
MADMDDVAIDERLRSGRPIGAGIQEGAVGAQIVEPEYAVLVADLAMARRNIGARIGQAPVGRGRAPDDGAPAIEIEPRGHAVVQGIDVTDCQCQAVGH